MSESYNEKCQGPLQKTVSVNIAILLQYKLEPKENTQSLTKILIFFLYSASKHFKLAMHIFGIMTQASTMQELDEILISATIVFSSSQSGAKVDAHFENLQQLLTNAGPIRHDEFIATEDYEVSL